MLPEISTILSGINSAISILASTKKHANITTTRINATVDDSSIETHLKYVNNWSANICVGGGAKNMPLDKVFIRLKLIEGQLRARESVSSSQKIIDQDLLLEEGCHKLILGGPGAGKTTTLKHLARAMFTTDRISENDTFDYPLLIECRTLKDEETIISRLLRLLGVDLSVEQQMPAGKKKFKWIHEAKLTGIRARECVINILNTQSVAVLIDGLDEVSQWKKTQIVDEIDYLSMHVDKSCISVTCRFGALQRTFDNSVVFAVQDFTDEDIKLFCERWFEDLQQAKLMLEELSKYSYSYIARTPLHISNLCLIFERRRTLPRTRLRVYENIVDLRLEAWDADRGIVRESKYGRIFTPKEKRRFLAALAFRMGMNRVGYRFNTAQLEKTYWMTAQRFGLPLDEAEIVVSEIESHNGLIVRSGDSEFEFYHLSIYEYLCAEYISRMQLNDINADDLFRLPEACAMAMELSAESDMFALHLVRRIMWLPDNFMAEYQADFWMRFLTRVNGEQIDVDRTKYLGLALILLWSAEWPVSYDPQRSMSVSCERRFSDVAMKTHAWAKELKASPCILAALRMFGSTTVGKSFVILHALDDWPKQIKIGRKTLAVRLDFYNWVINAEHLSSIKAMSEDILDNSTSRKDTD